MSDEYSKVVVTDIKIPFRSMVILMAPAPIKRDPFVLTQRGPRTAQQVVRDSAETRINRGYRGG